MRRGVSTESALPATAERGPGAGRDSLILSGPFRRQAFLAPVGRYTLGTVSSSSPSPSASEPRERRAHVREPGRLQVNPRTLVMVVGGVLLTWAAVEFVARTLLAVTLTAAA